MPAPSDQTAVQWTVSLPQPFPGTEAEKKANYQSHAYWDGDGRCGSCDCRFLSTSSGWACGSEVPRLVKTFLKDADDATTLVSEVVMAHYFPQVGGGQ